MTTLGHTFELSSTSSQNQRQYFKSSLDREYKLLASNQNSLFNSKNTRSDLDGGRDQFWKEASIRSEKRPTNKEATSEAVDPTAENKYYKQELQNLRSSFNHLREKAQQNKYGEQTENLTGLEKERIKRMQCEREEQLAEELDSCNHRHVNLGKNPIDNAEKKKVQIAYELREKEIKSKVKSNFGGDDHSHYPVKVSPRQVGKSLTHSVGSYKSEIQEQIEDESRESGTKEQEYFTNKELVRAKYEQYERELERQKLRGQNRKKQEESPEKEGDNEERNVEENREENLERKQQEFRDKPQQERRKEDYNENAAEFSRALEKKEKKLQQQYESLEKEKIRATRGLVYKEPIEQIEEEPEEKSIRKVEYSTKKPSKDKLLSLELEKLSLSKLNREENERIKREINQLQRRNSAEKRCYSAKLTKSDLRATYDPVVSWNGSKKLSEIRNQRTLETTKDFSEAVKEDLIKQTIQRARKDLHEKLQNNKQEKSWKEAKQRKTVDQEDVFLGYKTQLYDTKFHAGVPSNHLQESAFLLAKGIPTRYLSNRSVSVLSQSAMSRSSKSLKK